jgi:hypothetical protein
MKPQEITMKSIAARICSALLLTTAIVSCSTPVLEPTSSNTDVMLETPQVTDLLNGETNNSDLVGDGTVDGDTSLQAAAKPCFTYKVKKYVETLSSPGFDRPYGTIEVIKSPSCKSPLKVSFEGKYTSPKTPKENRVTASFDSTLVFHEGNKYYCYFEINSDNLINKPGTYGFAFRVKGGNVNKAVTEVKINVVSGW